MAYIPQVPPILVRGIRICQSDRGPKEEWHIHRRTCGLSTALKRCCQMPKRERKCKLETEECGRVLEELAEYLCHSITAIPVKRSPHSWTVADEIEHAGSDAR